jgi:hypothetical protein
MAGTSSTSVQQLYADVVADLQAYYDDAVLLPNQAFIMNSYDISGSAGNTIRIPLTNTYSNGVAVTEGGSIIGTTDAQSNLVPTAANITMSKFGIATDVSEESLEDGGVGVVRQAVLTRLSRGLAQAVDINGFATLKAGITQETGDSAGANVKFTEHFVMSPECLASGSKREPSVAVWYNPNKDVHEFRGTVRHGFAVMRPEFGCKITDRTESFATPTANLDNYLQAVSTLRGNNAPELADGSYIGFVSPKEEFAIAKQLASVGDASIGSLSDIGNRALLNGLIGQAAGITFFRSNNLPDATP